jgi:hypothetical protein
MFELFELSLADRGESFLSLFVRYCRVSRRRYSLPAFMSHQTIHVLFAGGFQNAKCRTTKLTNKLVFIVAARRSEMANCRIRIPLKAINSTPGTPSN